MIRTSRTHRSQPRSQPRTHRCQGRQGRQGTKKPPPSIKTITGNEALVRKRNGEDPDPARKLTHHDERVGWIDWFGDTVPYSKNIHDYCTF